MNTRPHYEAETLAIGWHLSKRAHQAPPELFHRLRAQAGAYAAAARMPERARPLLLFLAQRRASVVAAVGGGFAIPSRRPPQIYFSHELV